MPVHLWEEGALQRGGSFCSPCPWGTSGRWLGPDHAHGTLICDGIATGVSCRVVLWNPLPFPWHFLYARSWAEHHNGRVIPNLLSPEEQCLGQKGKLRVYRISYRSLEGWVVPSSAGKRSRRARGLWSRKPSPGASLQMLLGTGGFCVCKFMYTCVHVHVCLCACGAWRTTPAVLPQAPWSPYHLRQYFPLARCP